MLRNYDGTKTIQVLMRLCGHFVQGIEEGLVETAGIPRQHLGVFLFCVERGRQITVVGGQASLLDCFLRGRQWKGGGGCYSVCWLG